MEDIKAAKMGVLESHKPEFEAAAREFEADATEAADCAVDHLDDAPRFF